MKKEILQNKQHKLMENHDQSISNILKKNPQLQPKKPF